MEAYGPLTADPAAVHGADWAAARRETETRLEAALPRAAVDAAYAAWRPYADAAPVERLATGSGWGALEIERGGFELPGTPFDPDTLGEEQEPWRRLLRTGALPDWEPGSSQADPGASVVAPAWRDLLEAAPSTAAAEYHLGVAQWHAGDRAQAERSWERSLRCAETPWALRCLAVADATSGHPARAAERLLRAVRLLLASAAAPEPEAPPVLEAAGTGQGVAPRREGAGQGAAVSSAAGVGQGVAVSLAAPPVAADPAALETAEAALGREAILALLAADRADDARAVLDGLRPAIRARGRFRLLRAQVLLAQGDALAARAVFDEGFEVCDLREGDEALSDTWYAIVERLATGSEDPLTEEARARIHAEHPLPAPYEFRMRPA
ncbi:hypothetical protein SVIO_082000 [Streptomyces violaceusniger]|uniref:DUF5107 domain-containing protein n=1 Tax=Streptomyces violaceusniger TaxID=68280 RepID=A0A4D4LGI2_STRVO|nr:hypothetical protein SVIO_082000 [Streptomyces violaceusniger]